MHLFLACYAASGRRDKLDLRLLHATLGPFHIRNVFCCCFSVDRFRLVDVFLNPFHGFTVPVHVQCQLSYVYPGGNILSFLIVQ